MTTVTHDPACPVHGPRPPVPCFICKDPEDHYGARHSDATGDGRVRADVDRAIARPVGRAWAKRYSTVDTKHHYGSAPDGENRSYALCRPTMLLVIDYRGFDDAVSCAGCLAAAAATVPTHTPADPGGPPA